MERIKLLIILPNLRTGGAERVLSFIAQGIDKNQYKSQLLVLGKKSESAFHPNMENLHFLEKQRLIHAIPQLLFFIRKNKPDVVLSSIDHLNIFLGLISVFYRKTRFIIRVTSVLSAINQFSNNGKFQDFLSKIAYKNVDGVICQSNDMAYDFKKRYSSKYNNIRVIGNPITIQNTINPEPVERNKLQKQYITIGRLSKEKGIDRILNLLKNINEDFHYTIVGSGPEFESLKSLAHKNGIIKKVSFIPFTKDVVNYLIKSDYFLQGSHVEGFPNALLESCYCGIPVIAFNVPGGTKEIIESGINGFLVENDNQFIDALRREVNWNPDSIRNSVLEKYGTEKILEKYSDFITDVVKNAKNS